MIPRTYEGKEISITFDGNKCIHARKCVLTLPNVFQAETKGPWIKPDNASAEEIAALAHSCPSGAITYQRHDGATDEQPPAVNTIRLWENGPYEVRADIKLEGESADFRATLCRCGASKKKPYCDGSHHDTEFVATGEPQTQASEALKERNGPLAITPLADGPLLINGSAEIIAGTGRALTRTQKAALCRCGASGNKPFCDGTHSKIGFTTDK